MGIQNFLKNFTTYKLNNITNFDSIFLDGNYLLYQLIYKCENDNDLKNKVNNFINKFDSKISINKYVFIIFDGNYDNIEDINPKNLRKRTYTISDDYDKQPIKPGMEIIQKFKNYINNAIKNQIKKKFLKTFQIIIDDDSNPGEGDIKILNHIEKYKTKNNCIVSGDSDMILICSGLCLKYNINIQIMNKPNQLEFIKYDDYYNNYNYDFIIIMLLLGNDYLPKISNIEFDILINAYNNYKKLYKHKIIENNIFNENNFFEYIYTLIYCLKNNPNKKLNFSLNKIDCERIQKHYNNILWCLKLYKVIENENKYIEEKNDKVINIYNFYFLK
jgi:hypothetical protein